MNYENEEKFVAIYEFLREEVNYLAFKDFLILCPYALDPFENYIYRFFANKNTF